MKKIIAFLNVISVFGAASSSVFADSQKVASEPAQRSLSAVSAQGLSSHFIESFLGMSDDSDQEGINTMFESMALLISEELGRRGYTQDKVDSLSKEEMDEVLSSVFADAHTWTLDDLHEAAAPARKLAMEFGEDEAIDKYPYLAEQKAKHDAFLEMAANTTFTDVARGFYKDSYGYDQGYLQMSFQNNSSATVTHVEMGVTAFDGQPANGILFMKGDAPVEPGQVATLKAFVDPSSMLGPRFIKADSADIGYKLNSYYTVSGGRINEVEFTADMQKTFDLAEKIMAGQK